MLSQEGGGREARNAFTNRREVRDQEHVCPAEVTRAVVQLKKRCVEGIEWIPLMCLSIK